MENIKLDSGLFVNRLYGKYEPNLTFISSKELIDDHGCLLQKTKEHVVPEYKDDMDKSWIIADPSKTYYSTNGYLNNSVAEEAKKGWKKNRCIKVFEVEKIYQPISVEELQRKINCNLDASTVVFFRGKYRKSKKGTDVFDLTKRGDILVRVGWGGSFKKTRGRGDITSNTDGVKYYRRASSNGGGSGYTYFIVQEDWSLRVSEDDF